MSESKQMGVLVHGAGWVSVPHMQAFEKNPHTKVVAVSSRRMESCEKRAREAGLDLDKVKFYTDYSRALEQEDVDIVSVCTPQHLHAQNVIDAAQAKKHIVIEKPICNKLEDAKAMRDAVRSAGVRTVVSFVLRWNPLFETIKTMIADGDLGKVFYTEADYEHDMGSWYTGWDWARRKETGGSAFLIGGCHAIDAIRWFAGKGKYEPANITEVFAYVGGHRKGKDAEYNYYDLAFHEGTGALEYDDLEVAVVRFDTGAVGKVSVNMGCVQPYLFPLKVFGDKGTIRDNRVWAPVKFPGQNGWIDIPTTMPDSAEVSHHPFQGEMDHFIDCINSNKESHCNLEDAINTHEVAWAAQQCYRDNVPVKLPLIT